MKEAPTILVAEDLPNDVLLLQQAFSKAGLDVPLYFVRDGQEAIDYLNGEQSFADRATRLAERGVRLVRVEPFPLEPTVQELRIREGRRGLAVLVADRFRFVVKLGRDRGG